MINTGGSTAYATDLKNDTSTNGVADIGAFEFLA